MARTTQTISIEKYTKGQTVCARLSEMKPQRTMTYATANVKVSEADEMSIEA